MAKKQKINTSVRGPVARFAEAMEKKLKKNDHRPGWKNDSTRSLLYRVEDELAELQYEFNTHDMYGGHIDEMRDECVDVANFVMMIFDNLGRANATKED